MGKFTGTVTYTADDSNDYQQALNQVASNEEFILLTTDEQLMTIDIELV